MNVIVNEEPREVAEGVTVMDLLELLGLEPDATVVERNAVIVDRDRYDHTPLAQGDRLELLRFVGGG